MTSTHRSDGRCYSTNLERNHEAVHIMATLANDIWGSVIRIGSAM